MKKIVFTLSIFLSATILFSQKNVEITFNHKEQVLLNQEVINSDTKMETIKSLLGEPTLIKEYSTGKKVYHYPKLGISVHTYKGRVSMFGANFNWDGDKKFPETSFTGTFKIGEVEIKKDASESILKEIKLLKYKCIMPGMCIVDKRDQGYIAIIGFQDGLITQVGFEFSPK